MGKCIGLDFGTTYSVIAHLIEKNGVLSPEAINFSHGQVPTCSVESLVVVSDDEPLVGIEAVPAMNDDGAVIYNGFKMLLNCNDSRLLKNRGYNKKYTPEQITTVFLRGLFEGAKVSCPECKEIDKVVVGVPYVWTENGEDSRKFAVVDIVKETTGASLVEFRSEPTLACAYFVDVINKKREQKFEGYILVIDYGGGTLDVTLCKASNKNGQSSIEVENSWGAGENKDGVIGSAGLLFFENVADILLKEQGIIVDNKDEQAYLVFKKRIESIIKQQTVRLHDNFQLSRYRSPNGARYHATIGEPVYYKGTECRIKYSTLVEAYDAPNGIRKILDQVLTQAKSDMDRDHIPYDDYTGGTFKIALIGGFCKFALTDLQIREDMDWLKSHHATGDTRYSELDEAVSPMDRDLAIAYGAALNANNIVDIKNQFPYTLCFYAEEAKTDKNGNPLRDKDGRFITVADESEEFVMFRENEEYEPGKPVFFGIKETNETGDDIFIKIPCGGDEIPFMRRLKKSQTSEIDRPKFKMSLPGTTISGSIYIAMAMERNEELTLYVYDQSIFDSLPEEEQIKPINKAIIGEPTRFPNIDKLLGTFYRTYSTVERR